MVDLRDIRSSRLPPWASQPNCTDAMRSLRPWLVCAIAIVVGARYARSPYVRFWGRLPLIATNPRLATGLVLGEMRNGGRLLCGVR